MAAPGLEARGAGRTATAAVLLGAHDSSSAAPAFVIDPLAPAEGATEHFDVGAGAPGGEGADGKSDADDVFVLEPGSRGGSLPIAADPVEDADRFTFVVAQSGQSSGSGTPAPDAMNSPPPAVDSFAFSAPSLGAIGDEPGLRAGLSTIQADLIVSGLDFPVFAASPPGDADRLFIIEKNSGRVLILDLDTNQVLAQPFYDVAAGEMTIDGERGLLGMAFHPDYAANGKLYLDLTNENGDIEIWELTRSANPDLADPASQRVLLTVPRDPANSNHNGGWIDFGPDGLLYIAVGDGGAGNDPPNNAQNINDLRGKMLRIDVDSDAFPADPARNYAIPAGNPFVGVNGADEVFAYGLRNPFRASFDSLTGDFYIGDVGQNAREEVDFLPAGTGAGTNFGWRVMEGTLPTGLPQLGNPPAGDPSLRPPIFEYGPEVAGSSSQVIIGGYVYRGPGGGQGLYFFADPANNKLFTLRVENGQAFDFSLRNAEVVNNGGTLDQIASFAVDGHDRLYAIGLDGEVFRLTPSEDFGPLPPPETTSGGGDSGVILAIGILLGAAAWVF